MASAEGLISQGILIKFGADLTGLSSGMNQAKSILGGLSSPAGVATAGIAALGVAAIGVGIAATKMAANYQQSMNKVQALTGASTDQMKQFDSGLKQLSMETGVVPQKLADGLYNVMSAGYKGKDAMTVLALATKDSVIGMTSATVTTDALTNVLASFGMGAKDAQRVNGEMLDTVTLGKSTFEQYANSIVKSASAANQFHESMETMNAAFATMTSSGIRAAQASTDFQASLKVMDGNIGAVVKSLNKNGIAFDQAKFNAMDYGHKIVYLNTALDEANAKHVHVTGVTIQAAQAISTIAKHIDTYNTDLAELSNKQAMAAKTQEAWAITQQGFNVSLQRLRATAQVVMIDIGQKLLPIATGGVNLLNDAFQGLMDVAGKVSDSINAFGASLDRVGIRKLAGDFSYFTAQTKDLFQVIQGIGMSIFAQFNTHLVDTHTLIGFISTVMQDLGNVFRVAGEGVGNFTKILEGANISGSVIDGYNKFKTLIEDVAKVVGYVLYEAFEKAKSIYESFRSTMQSPGMQMLIDELGKVWNAVKSVADIIKNTAIKTFDQFKDSFNAAKNAGNDLNTVLSKLTGVPLDKLSSIKDKLTPKFTLDSQAPPPNYLNLPQLEKNKPAPVGGSVSQGSGSFGPLSQIIDIVGKAHVALQNFGTAISHINMQPFIDGMLQLKGPILNILSLQWDQFKTVLKDVGQDAKQVGDWFMSSVVPAFKQAAPGFANLGMTMLTTVIPAFIQIRGVVIDVVQHAFTTFAPIIERIVPPLIKFAGILANDVANGLKFITPYVLQAAKAIGDFAKDIMDRVAPIITNVINGITPILKGLFASWNTIWPSMSQVLKGVWDIIVGVIKIAWSIVTGIFKIALDLLSGNWSGAWKDMKDMLSGVWDGIKDVLSGAWEVIKGTFKTGINWVIDQINGLIKGINSINVAGVHVNIPLIPHLASGTENFAGGLALVGEQGPELVSLPGGASVLNNNKTSAVMNAAKSTFQYPTAGTGSPGGGMSPVVHVHVYPVVQPNDMYVDGYKLTERLGPHMANKIRLEQQVRRH